MSCPFCGEPTGPGDPPINAVVLDDDGRPVGRRSRAHRECLVRQAVGGPGHLLGRCTCCGGTEDPDLGMTPRDAARWVAQWLRARGEEEW